MSSELDQLHPAICALKVVCRCNNVKYRTIEKAIVEGCLTVGAIAARTTATTGHCGGSCTPDIVSMIDDAAKPAQPAKDDQTPWWIRK